MSNATQDARQKRYDQMTKTPIPQLVGQLAVPTIISMLVSNLYNMADTFFVGRISTQATAAVGIVFSVMAMIQSLGFFCGHGSGNYMSRRLGAEDTKDAEQMAATGFFLAFCLGLIFMILGLVFINPFVRLLGATPTILEDTKAYLRIILCGAPFMCAQLVINNQLRFQGSAVYAMVGLVSGAVVNTALDPLFIFGLDMGIEGAALATILSQLLSFAILLIGSYQGPNIHIHLKNIRLTRHYLLQILNGGSPSLARQGINSISTIILNTMAGALGGDAAIAGMSVVNRFMMLANAALIGFGQGFQPVSAFNYGAGLWGRVRKAFFYCVKVGTVFLCVMAVLGFAFAPQIIGFFRDDPEVIAVGKVALRFQACVFPLNAAIVMSNMMLQSIGKGVRATIMASARNGLFFIPLILILSHAFGLLGVEMTQTWSDVLSFLITFPLTGPVLEEMRRHAATEETNG